MGLVVQTPQGDEWLTKQTQLLERIGRTLTADVIQTPCREDASVDAILSRKGEAVALLEVKCRRKTLAEMQEMGTGLVTAMKLEDGIIMASKLRLPFYVFFGLSDGTIGYWYICDKYAIKQLEWDTRRTETKSSVDSVGTVHRLNAFLPMSKMRILKELPRAH